MAVFGETSHFGSIFYWICGRYLYYMLFCDVVYMVFTPRNEMIMSRNESIIGIDR